VPFPDSLRDRLVALALAGTTPARSRVAVRAWPQRRGRMAQRRQGSAGTAAGGGELRATDLDRVRDQLLLAEERRLLRDAELLEGHHRGRHGAEII